MFQRAVKSQAKLRMAIIGPSGSGKTYTALTIALGLVGDGRIALVDTEHGSSKKYADDFSFDVMEMDPPFHPDRFTQAIEEAVKLGYSVIVLDSLSHAWNGTGGLLEIVDGFATKMKAKNTFAAWKDATPIQNRLIDSIVRNDIHIIATMRSKHEYVIEQIERDGRVTNMPRKIGTAPVQRDSFEYEFDIVADMDLEHNLIVSKTRCRALDGQVISKPTAKVAEVIKSWLSDGVAPPPVKPAEANGKRKFPTKREGYLAAIHDLLGECESLGNHPEVEPRFLDNATDDELVEFGKELRQRVEKIKLSQLPEAA